MFSLFAIVSASHANNVANNGKTSEEKVLTIRDQNFEKMIDAKNYEGIIQECQKIGKKYIGIQSAKFWNEQQKIDILEAIPYIAFNCVMGFNPELGGFTNYFIRAIKSYRVGENRKNFRRQAKGYIGNASSLEDSEGKQYDAIDDKPDGLNLWQFLSLKYNDGNFDIFVGSNNPMLNAERKECVEKALQSQDSISVEMTRLYLCENYTLDQIGKYYNMSLQAVQKRIKGLEDNLNRMFSR